MKSSGVGRLLLRGWLFSSLRAAWCSADASVALDATPETFYPSRYGLFTSIEKFVRAGEEKLQQSVWYEDVLGERLTVTNVCSPSSASQRGGGPLAGRCALMSWTFTSYWLTWSKGKVSLCERWLLELLDLAFICAKKGSMCCCASMSDEVFFLCLIILNVLSFYPVLAVATLKRLGEAPVRPPSKWRTWRCFRRCRGCCSPRWSGWEGSSSSWSRRRHKRRCGSLVPPRSASRPSPGSWTATGGRVRWGRCRGDSATPNSKPGRNTQNNSQYEAF